MTFPRLRTVLWLLPAIILGGCSATQQTAVRPIETVMDQAALDAGELRIAASALQSGDINVARSLYQDLTRSHPDVPDIWLGLGDTYFLSGEFEAAQAAYTHAEQLDPTQLGAKLALARVDVRLRRLDQARDRFQSILASRPNEAIALAGLGVVYDMQGQPGLAQETYRKGLAIHPGDEALRTNLGLSLALNGKPREAVNILLGHSGVTGALPQTRDNLALAYGVLGREDAAEHILLSYQPRGLVQDNLEFYRYLRQQLGQPGNAATTTAEARR